MGTWVDPKTGKQFENAAEDAASKAGEFGLVSLEQYEKEQRSGGAVDQLRTVGETAAATVGETVSGVTGALVGGRAVEKGGYATTPEALERREVNPNAALVGAVLPDLAAAALIPGAGAAGIAGRAVAGGLLAEGGETAVTGEPFDLGDAALYGLTAGALEGVGTAVMGRAMKAAGKGRDLIEQTVNRARTSAVADAVAETEPLAKAAKSAANAPDLHTFHQAQLDDALSAIEEKVASASDSVFSQGRLRQTIPHNPEGQGAHFLELEGQLLQAAEVSDVAAVKQAAIDLQQATGQSGPKMYDALRKVRKTLADGLSEAAETAVKVEAPDLAEDYALQAARKRLRGVADHTGDAELDALVGQVAERPLKINEAGLPNELKLEINRRTQGASLDDVKRWVSDREALRGSMGRTAAKPPSPLGEEALRAIDESLENEALWGRAAKNHKTLKDIGSVPRQGGFDITDTAGRQSLMDSIAEARKVAETTGDEGLLKLVGKAEKAIAASDGVKGAQVMSEATAAKVDLAEQLAEKFLKKGGAKAVSKAVSTAAGFAFGGPGGALLGNLAGDLAEPFVEALAKKHKMSVANVLRKFIKPAQAAAKAAEGAGETVARGASKAAVKESEKDLLESAAATLGRANATESAATIAGRSEAPAAPPSSGMRWTQTAPAESVDDFLKRSAAMRGQAGSASVGALGLGAGAGVAALAGGVALQDDGAEQEAATQRQTVAQLSYLKQQAQTAVETTARAVASPAQNLRTVPRVPGVTSSAGVASFIGSSGNLTTAYDSRKKTLKLLSDDPMALVDELTDGLSKVEGSNPELHRKLVEQTYKVVGFLQTKLPGTIGASLSRPEGTPPNPIALRQFALYYSAATDPASVLGDLTHNRAQKEQVDTLRELWPDTYDKLKVNILDQMSQARPTVAQRMRMDLLFDFGESLDTALSSRLVATHDAYKEREAKGGGPKPSSGGTAAPPQMPSRTTNPTIKATGALSSLSVSKAA